MDTMLSKALREFTSGPLHQLLVNLGGKEGDQWEHEFKQFLRKEPCWAGVQVTRVAEPETTPLILKFFMNVDISETRERFVAKEKFVCGNAEIRLIGSNFREWFLSGVGKIEDPMMEHTLCCHTLLQPTNDDSILAELAVAGINAETTLAEMFSLAEKQGCGEYGVLLTNDKANIFFIKDVLGVLRTVRASYKDGHGWSFHAIGSIDRSQWLVGGRVFSHVPFLQSSEPSA